MGNLLHDGERRWIRKSSFPKIQKNQNHTAARAMNGFSKTWRSGPTARVFSHQNKCTEFPGIAACHRSRDDARRSRGISREREATRSLRSLAVDRADCSIAYPQGALNACGVGTHPEKLRCLDGPLSRRLRGLHGRRHAQALPCRGRRRALGKGLMNSKPGSWGFMNLLLSA